MLIKMSEAQMLLGALRKYDDDATLKLSDKTRLRIAININALMGPVTAFETTRNKVVAEMQGENGALTDPVLFNERMNEMLGEEIDVRLKRLNFADLKATKGEHTLTNLAALSVIIRDFTSAEGNDDED